MTGYPVVPAFGSTTGTVLWLIATVLMPVVVGLVTKIHTSSGVQSLMLLGLSLVNGLVSEWLSAGDGYDWRKAVVQVVITYVVAVASHFGAWKPLGVTSAALRAGSSSPRGL